MLRSPLFCPQYLPSIVEGNSTGFDQVVHPFLKMYCLRCHNEQKQKGEFRIDTLYPNFENKLVIQDWAELINRVNGGEMPPEEEFQPTADEIGKVVGWISNRIREGEAVRMAKHGWMWNISGLDAVELTYHNGKKLRIGTDEPEVLLEALKVI